MSEISVIEVKSTKEMMAFITFPMELYKNNKNFVPPLIAEEKQIWNPRHNPALQYSEARLFLAYRDQKMVGRTAVIINFKEKKELGIDKVRFGWIDFVSDPVVSQVLIEKEKDFAREKNIPKIEGPMGFTNLDKSGVLSTGFDRLATMIGIYNAPYYAEHFEKAGLEKEKEWVEYELVFPEQLPEKIIRFNDLILQKYQLKVLNFNSKKQILPYVEPMFKLLDETYRHLSSYTPITDEQIHTYRNKYFKFIDKDY